jgi:hypothetical protein
MTKIKPTLPTGTVANSPGSVPVAAEEHTAVPRRLKRIISRQLPVCNMNVQPLQDAFSMLSLDEDKHQAPGYYAISEVDEEMGNPVGN